MLEAHHLLWLLFLGVVVFVVVELQNLYSVLKAVWLFVAWKLGAADGQARFEAHFRGQPSAEEAPWSARTLTLAAVAVLLLGAALARWAPASWW
ncbi:MAG: hypothetical protein HY814_09030 [Candidatus Riflebacteria bacterium]|nr:hypothetical protein [Candidatus Riflebacteria bacterium]